MIRPRWTLPAACVAGVFAAFMIVTGAAAATTPTLVADPIRGPGGTTVALLGAGFCVSCGVVEIDFAARPVKRGIVVGADGSFQTTFVVPGGAQAGTDAINAYQQGVLVAQTAFEVTPSIPAPSGQPPTLSPQPTPTPAQSPRNTPTATPTPTPTPTGQPSPVSSGGSGSPSPVAVAGPGDFPVGLFVAIVIILAVAGAAITVVWWQRRRT